MTPDERQQFQRETEEAVKQFAVLMAARNSGSTGIPKAPEVLVTETETEPERFGLRLDPRAQGASPGGDGGPTPPSPILYIQFKTLVQDTGAADGLLIGSSLTDYNHFIGSARVTGAPGTERVQFSSAGHIVNAEGGSWPEDTWLTIDYKIVFGATPEVTFRIDGVEVGSAPYEGGPITTFYVGAVQNYASDQNTNFDDVKIGTTDWGSDDLFSADFASAIVPPFDSVTGSDLSLDAGTLNVVHVADDPRSYASKSLSFP